jgi:formylmethanofuran dehydrogenase subunit E
MVHSFHGSIAPGVMLGGFMVDLAYRNLPSEILFDVIMRDDQVPA